ncbi:Ig-like domain-containing protein [Metaplanococcus flavidus]
MRKIISLLLIAALLIPNFAFAADLGITNGTNQYTIITESQTWGESKTIDENLIIAPDVVVSINAGVTINLNADLIVYGHIQNSGTLNLNNNNVFANNVKMGFSMIGDSNYLQYGVIDPAGSIQNVNQLNVKADLYPAPPISYNLPEKNLVRENTYTLTGNTVPGFTIKAGTSETVAQTDGSFALELVLEEGENVYDIQINNVFNREFTLESVSLTMDTSEEADIVAPQLLETSPSDGSENIDVNNPISFTFDEEILEGAAFTEIIITDSKNTAVSAEVSILNNTLSLTPNAPLANGEQYTVLLPVGSITDKAGNAIADQITLTFKTVLAEVDENENTPPVLMATEPANNAMDVSIESPMNFVFNERIQAGINYQDIKVHDANNDQVSVRTEIIEDRLIISPETQWSHGTQYTVSVPAESVMDMEGLPGLEMFLIAFTTIVETEEEIPLPAKPVVNRVIEGETKVTGTAEVGTTVFVKAGDSIWSNQTNAAGEFSVDIDPQEAGVELRVSAKNSDGLESIEVLLIVGKVQGSIGGTQIKGKISEDTIWTKANSPYTLVGQVEVTNGAKLTVEPGVEVRGSGNIIAFNWGTFESKGSSTERVLFENTQIESSYDSTGTMDIQYTDFIDGSFNKNGTGSFTLRDSKVEAYTYLNLRSANSVIERNAFKLSHLDLSVNNEKNHTIKNNMFYKGFSPHVHQTIRASGYAWAPGQILIEQNSFIGGEGSNTHFLEIDYSSSGIKAQNNYWNASVEEKIDDKIRDGKDNGKPEAVLSYTPFLEVPHIDTPKLDVLAVSDVRPEPRGYDVSVNSDIEIEFNREIKLLNEWNGITVYARDTGLYLPIQVRVEMKKLIISIPEGMNPNTNYEVSIQEGTVSGVDEVPLEEVLYFSFWTSSTDGSQIKGKISEDTIWTKANSPYTLVGQVEVTNGAKLTVEPGVEVRGSGNIIAFNWGTFESKGSSTERVLFENTQIESSYDSTGTMDIQYTDFIDGSFNKNGTGSFTLRDSKVEAYTYLNLRSANSVIERNAFKLSHLDLSVNNEKNHTIKNNMFYKGFSPHVHQTIRASGYAWAPGQILIEQNSFIGGEGSNTHFLEIDYSSSGIKAQNNYWNASVEEKIDDKIRDGKDNGKPEAVLSYTPFLEVPHIDTPKLDVLAVSDVRPEPRGYDVSVNSDIEIEFNREIKLLNEWNGITVYARDTGLYLPIQVRVEMKKLIISIPEGMNPNTNYEVSIQEGTVSGVDEVPLEEVLYFSFWTSSTDGSQIKGKISEDTIWTKANSPYTLVGQVEVTNGAKLTVEPGVEVRGSGNIIAFNWGTFESKGSSTERVLFENTQIESSYDSTGTMDIQYTDFIDGSFNKNGTGSFTLRDSKVEAYTYLNLRSANSVIERNAFKLSHLDLSVNNEKNHTIKNNMFYKGFSPHVHQTIRASGYAWAPGQILIEQNSFIGGEGSNTHFLEIDYSSSGIKAQNNYWNASVEEKIDDKIRDGKDNGKPEAVLSYTPFLEVPHIDTPKLDVLAVSDVRPEPRGYDVSVNSDIEIEFNREIKLLNEWNGITVYARDTGLYLPIQVRVEMKKLIISIPEGMNPNTNYEVSIQEGTVSGVDEVPLEEVLYFSFWTSNSLGPAIPNVNEITDKSLEVTGTTEPKALVTVKAVNTEIGTANADDKGNYSVIISKQKAGTILKVTATDGKGHSSLAKEVTVSDATAPDAPKVDEVTDKSTAIKGTGEVGAAISIKSGTTELGKTTVMADGTFSVTISKQKAGTKINVYATDAAGNVSEATIVTVLDATAPVAPTADEVTDKSTSVSGTGELAAMISVKVGANEIAASTVDETGKFTVSIPRQKAGTVLNITAADKAGNVSAATSVTVIDVTAPSAPVVDEVTDQSTFVTGSGEVAALISIKAGTKEIGTATVGSDGKYKATIALQKAGTVVNVTATDKAGNVSITTAVTVSDVTAPSAPVIDKVSDKSTSVTGTAEIGALIIVKSGYTELGTSAVKDDGSYSVTISKQKAGTKISVTATDKTGHVSEAASITVFDATAPDAPKVDEVTDQSTSVTGLGEIGALISVKVGTNEIGTAKVDSLGKFSVVIVKQKAGSKLSVTAKDVAGNISDANVKTVLDVTAPTAPTVSKVTDKSTVISGEAEVNAFISVKAGTLRLGTATVKADGTYSVAISKQKAGTELSVTAIDDAGNTSEATLTTVLDATAPNAPSVNEVTDKATSIKGLSEAASQVSVKVGSQEIGTAKAEADGKYSVVISKQKAGTILSVTATDATGNISDATETTVLDATAPAAPTVNKVTDKSLSVSGLGEVNALISVRSGSVRLGTAIVEKDGTYSMTIPLQKAGTQLIITAFDQAGNQSEETLVTVLDATAPNAPTVNKVTDKSTEVTGSGEVDSLITIKVGTTKLATGSVKADETYTIAIPKQKAGTKLNITASDATGNISKATEFTVLDVTAPVAPTVNKVTDKSTTVTGTAEVNALIFVKSGSAVLGEGKVEVDGTYSVTIPKQQAGSKLSITAADVAGNVSSPRDVIVLDVTAPNIPVVDKVTDQSTFVMGTAEAATQISVRTGSLVIGTATVKADGSYSVSIPKQKVGTVLTVTAIDKADNISPVREVTVVRHTLPAIAVSNKVTHHSTRVIGTAEAASKITVKAGTKLIGTAMADAEGHYQVVIAKQNVGTKLSVTATDAAGNSSAPITISVVDGNYPDLKVTHWALNEIMYLGDEQIIGGYPNGKFDPEKNTSRAEAAKMLVTALDLPVPIVSSSYKDVSSKHWAKDYIAAATKAGLFNGNPDGTFAPDKTLKRSEMAKIISLAYEFKASGESHFKDVKSGYWASGYISGLYENGITTGYSDKTFRAEQSTTRAEFSVFLARALNKDFR